MKKVEQMKQRSMIRVFLALCATTVLFAGCGGKKESGETKPALQGTVTFVCGQAQLIEGDKQTTLDIGMNVPADASIVTGPDATCEVQFADYGSVHLSSNTRLTVSLLLRDGSHTEAEMKLAVGSIVCKVRKLSGNDRFNVRTEEMVAGVRGTVFFVSTDGSTASKIAVSEGSVSVSPVSTVTGVAKDGENARNAVFAVSEQIVSAMPCLATGEEVIVTKASMEEADRIVREIYSAAETAKAGDAAPAAAVEKIVIAANAMKTAGVAGKAMSVETKAAFDSASYLDIRDLSLAVPAGKDSSAGDAASTQGAGDAASAQGGKKLVSLTVSADPADATVSINGATLSKGAFRGLFDPEESVELAVTKDGFKEYRETIAMSGGESVTRTVRLESGADATKNNTVEPLAVRAFPVSSVKIVALSLKDGTAAFASDAAGKVFSFGSDGKVRWSAATGNGANGNSPVVAGGTVVAYAGDRLLVAFDAATGAKLWQKELGKEDSGLFGRKPLFAQSALVMSSDSGLVSCDVKTGVEIARFAIANGSDMSPAFSDGCFYIASKSGVFHAIDAATMTGKASVQTAAVQPVASAPVLSGDRAIVADRRGLVSAVSLSTMTVAWQKKLDPAKSVEIFSDPVVTADSVYVAGKDALYALSLADGSPRFSAVKGISTQPCIAKGYLWCGSGSSLLQIIPATGAVAGKFPLPAAASGRPVYDGTILYVPLANGSVGVMALDTVK